MSVNDLVIKLSGKFPYIMSEIMENVLGKILYDSGLYKCTLAINSTKMVLMLFVTKPRVCEFQL